tara:strand:- start:169 stop:357 length:189 start_codon:yes stop_codon:yes gene_type:complete
MVRLVLKAMLGQANPYQRDELRELETPGLFARGNFIDSIPSRKSSLQVVLASVPQTDTGMQG